MGVKYVTYESIDKVKWDKCIDTCAHHIAYGYSWYLDAVAENWDALILEDYKAVFPLVYREKYGVKYLYQPFFTQQLGLFLALDASETSLDSFLSAIPKKFRFWDIQLNGHYDSNQFELLPRVTYQLQLNQPYEALEEAYSKDGKKSIRKANAEHWELRESNQIDLIIEDYRQAYGDRNLNIQFSDYESLKNLLEISLNKERAELYELMDEEGLRMASAVFIKSNKHLHYILGAPTLEGRKRNATHVLLDRVIEKHSSSKMTLDFEGSEIPSVAYFYQKFGSKPHTYYKLRVNRLPRFLRWLK